MIRLQFGQPSKGDLIPGKRGLSDIYYQVRTDSEAITIHIHLVPGALYIVLRGRGLTIITVSVKRRSLRKQPSTRRQRLIAGSRSNPY
jgi:hypothetical protein